MAEIDKSYAFEAVEYEMTFYNGQALRDFSIDYTFNDEEETLYTFPGYVSSFMYIYNERGGQLIKSFTNQITRNSNIQVFNCSVADMTFADCGKYYYEIGFNSNGYENLLRYGNAFVK